MNGDFTEDFELDDSGLDGETESVFITDDETGEETELLVLDTLLHNGVTYHLTLEAEYADEEDACAVMFKETDGGSGEFFFEPIEDDAEFETVAELFKERSGGAYEAED